MFNLALVPKLNAMAMLDWSIYRNWLRIASVKQTPLPGLMTQYCLFPD